MLPRTGARVRDQGPASAPRVAAAIPGDADAAARDCRLGPAQGYPTYTPP